MKRPSLQFYPADWRNNAKLRRCSWEARGAWLEVICLMHDSEEYGVLRWPLKEIAQAIGAPVKLLNELAEKGVLKGSDKQHGSHAYAPRSGRRTGEPVTLIEAGNGPMWMSSRMVEDEYIRQNRGKSSRFGDDNTDNSDSPKGGFGEGFGEHIGDGFGASPNRSPSRVKSDGSTSSSTSTYIKEKTTASIPPVDNSAGRSPPTPPATEAENPKPPDRAVERNVQFSVLLRGWERDRGKFAKITSSAPQLLEWASKGVTDAQLREAYDLAVEMRKAKGDDGAVNAGIVDTFLAQILNHPPGMSALNSIATGAKPWQASWTGIVAKGKELGIFQSESEHPQAFKARVFEAAQMTPAEKAVLRADFGVQV